MKKSITVIALLAGAVGVHAQGTVNFQTYLTTFNIAVWSPSVTAPSVQTQGNTSSDLPAGSTTYSGVPLGGSASGSGFATAAAYGNGNDFTIGLYAVPGLGQTINLVGTQDLIATATFANSGGTGAVNVINGVNGGLAGSWVGNSAVAIPNAGTGSAGTATIELAAWYNGGSSGTTYATYSAAKAAGVPTGISSVASLNGLGGPNPAGPSSFPAVMSGITSFDLTSVPEPSTIALGVIGASAFLMRLRRKQ